jgi:superkiller protein 3
MKNLPMPKNAVLAATLLFSVLTAALPSPAQDVAVISDITGGSSVFIFRGSQKSATRKFTSQERSGRSKSQRIAVGKKITRQYVTLAKTAPRRTRTEAVNPEDPRIPKIATMPKDQASKLFAGVGEYYIDKENPEEASNFFREAFSLDARNSIAKNGLSEALALRGNDMMAKDKPDEAKKFFDEALTFNPNNAVAYFGLGEMYSGVDDDAKAIASYEKALSLDKALTEIYVPLGILYYQGGEIAKADNLLTKAIAVAPEDAETQYFLGLVRYAQNNNDAALRAFQKAKALDPNYAEAYFYTGQTLVRQQKTGDAVNEFLRATSLKPNYFEANFALGSAYFELENYPGAIKAYTEATRLKNDNVAAQANLGDAYRLNGDYNLAESRYNLAATFLERDKNFGKTDSADIYSKIGYVLAKQCEINMRKFIPCKWNTATRALEKAVEQSQSPIDYANLGWAYYNAARADLFAKQNDQARAKLIKARDSLLKAVDSNTQYFEGPLLNLGMTYTDLGDYPGAIEALTRVVKRQPTWTFALNELGIAYLNNKNYSEASNQFKKAIARDDNFAAAHFNLGKSEYLNGNLGETKKQYQKLKELKRRDLAGQLELLTLGAVTR